MFFKSFLSEWEKYHVHPFKEGSGSQEGHINFSHPKTGVYCELVYLGKYENNYRKMGQFLKEICSQSSQVKMLIMAVKIWTKVITFLYLILIVFVCFFYLYFLII